MSSTQEPRKTRYTAHDLFNGWAAKDVTVYAVLSAWKHGQFDTFEAALIHLAMTLAAEKAEFMAQVVKFKNEQSPAVVVSQNFCK